VTVSQASANISDGHTSPKREPYVSRSTDSLQAGRLANSLNRFHTLRLGLRGNAAGETDISEEAGGKWQDEGS